MAPRKGGPRVGDHAEVTIRSLAYGGRGVARLGTGGERGMTVFVDRAAPGDQARIHIDRVKRRHAEASIVAVESPGAGRIDPPCGHYAEGCGGCSWQHIEYDAQLRAKEEIVRDSLSRIGEFADVEVAPIVAADEPWFYRNKMEFSFHAADGLGLHVRGDWRRVVPITECRLESELAMRVLEVAREFFAGRSIVGWDPETNSGFLREIVIRHGQGTGETMVGLVTERGEFPDGEVFAARLADLDGSIVSVVRAIRGAFEDGSPIERVDVLRGRETITERVRGLDFAIGLQTFFQTSTVQAARMLDLVRREVHAGFEAAPDGTRSQLLDVFCGVGFFTLGLADMAETAVGVEIVEPSIIAARANAVRNEIDNCVFYAGDARRTLPVVLEEHGAPGVVVIDPPRSGAGGKVMRRLARAAPHRLVYVSCNPTTLARDLRELHPFGYRLQSVQPLDLFPQTYHVETIVTMDRLAEPDPEVLKRRR